MEPVEVFRTVLWVFLAQVDGMVRQLSRSELVLVIAASWFGSYIFLNGGAAMVERGRGGTTSRQGGMAVLLGMLCVLGGAALSVRLATGWDMSRCLVAAVGGTSVVGVANRLGVFKLVRARLEKRKQASEEEQQARLVTWQQFVASTDAGAFERFAGWLFRQKGYRARVVGAPGDQGIDVELERDGLRAVAQCKRYTDRAVTAGEVRDFYGAMVGARAMQGYMLTTSKYTQEARQFAKRKTGGTVALWDREELEPWAARWGTAEMARLVCRFCNAENRPDARYCRGCGAPLP